MKEGWHKVPGASHLFAYFNHKGNHWGYISIYGDNSPGVDYFETEAGFIRGGISSYRKINDSLDFSSVHSAALQDLRDLADIIAPSPAPPAPALGALLVDLGPHEDDPKAAMQCRSVLKAKDALTKQVQRKLQSWPYGKQLDFTLNGDSLEVRWVDT
jgi:hypothetical protein